MSLVSASLDQTQWGLIQFRCRTLVPKAELTGCFRMRCLFNTHKKYHEKPYRDLARANVG